MRTSSDIDIMVSTRDSRKVDAILEQLGFKTQYNLKNIDDKVLKKMLSVMNEISYYNASSNMAIDVHYKLTHSHIRFYSFEKQWAERQTINYLTMNVLIRYQKNIYGFICVYMFFSCLSTITMVM